MVHSWEDFSVQIVQKYNNNGHHFDNEKKQTLDQRRTFGRVHRKRKKRVKIFGKTLKTLTNTKNSNTYISTREDAIEGPSNWA